jgi:hypothetical protein
MCKTNPIGGPEADDCGLAIADGGLEDAGPEQQTLALVKEEANLTVETCKTNPISPAPEEGLAAWGEEVRSDANPYDPT